MAVRPAPKPHELLPPLLACLPTAFISPRPPPALLPLLSPILRQRVNLLSSAGAPADGGWLSLLSWDPSRASKVASKVEGMQLEAHPVSGELELQEIENIGYRRLDQETLHVRFEVEEFELLPIYLWCDTDEQGGGPAWRLTELRALEDKDDGSKWYSSESEATQAFSQSGESQKGVSHNGQHTAKKAQEDDDDDYWASYDRTPGRTPKRSPVASQRPFTNSQTTKSDEDDYYARYSTVQPAMDNHDPDEAPEENESRTINGLPSLQPSESSTDNNRPPSVPVQRSLYPADAKPVDSAMSSANGHPLPSYLAPSTNNLDSHIQHPIAPRPTSPASSASEHSVAKLERGAESMTRAEVGVKQHISAEVKNLFRLASSVGIDRGEFERIVRTQIDVLGMMDGEEY